MDTCSLKDDPPQNPSKCGQTTGMIYIPWLKLCRKTNFWRKIPLALLRPVVFKVVHRAEVTRMVDATLLRRRVPPPRDAHLRLRIMSLYIISLVAS
jgi:hypothetical protein